VHPRKMADITSNPNRIISPGMHDLVPRFVERYAIVSRGAPPTG
jgi:hypothetical protein